jgi:hypothetical protein
MTPANRRRLLGRIDQSLYQVEHGPLAKFPLFNEVAALTPGVRESYSIPRAQLVKAEQALGAKLVDLVRRGDSESLSKVARTVEHFLDRPECPRLNLKNPETLAEFRTFLNFLREHIDEYWTIAELQQRLADETDIRPHTRTLSRWCKQGLKFPIKPDKLGRPKSKFGQVA